MTSIIQLIRTTYTELRKSERKVADYVLGHADEVIHMRIVDLAQEAHVSEPTVVRFCRAIGYNSFQSFKLAVAQYVAHHPREQARPTPELPVTAGQQRLQADIAGLSSLQRDLDEVALAAATRRLEQAARILILPLQLPLVALAIQAQYRLFTAGRCALAAGALPQPADALALLEPGDALLVLGHSAAATELLTTVRERGVVIVQIAATGAGVRADHHLHWHGGSEPWSTQVLVELLLAPLASKPLRGG